MSVEVPEQREPLIEGRPDLFASIVWFQFVVELADKAKTLQATVDAQAETITTQQTAIDDLTSRVEALESLHP